MKKKESWMFKFFREIGEKLAREKLAKGACLTNESGMWWVLDYNYSRVVSTEVAMRIFASDGV